MLGNTGSYLPFPGDGVLKQEVRALCLLDVVFALRGEQEALADIVGEGWGRSGGHRLVAGVPAPVSASGAAVAGRQALLPAPAGGIGNCTCRSSTGNQRHLLSFFFLCLLAT